GRPRTPGLPGGRGQGGRGECVGSRCDPRAQCAGGGWCGATSASSVGRFRRNRLLLPTSATSADTGRAPPLLVRRRESLVVVLQESLIAGRVGIVSRLEQLLAQLLRQLTCLADPLCHRSIHAAQRRAQFLHGLATLAEFVLVAAVPQILLQ